jgi:outer membrane protein TolC
MKTVRRLILMLLAMCSINAALLAQEPTKFTIKEAVEYAKKHNISMQSRRIDEDLSRKKVKEVLADGLPQVSAGLSYTNNIQIATQRLPNFINDALPPGSPRGPEFINAQFGVANSLTATAQLTQLIFDGTYFLGIKAAQEFVQMSELQTQQTERDVEINTVKAYYSVLMAEKRLAMMDDNMRSLDSTMHSMRALALQGFAEMIDTARIALSMSNLRIQKNRLEDQRRVMLNVLKLQMGFDVTKPIALAETSESLEAQLKVIDVSTEGNIVNRSEYKILDQQVKLGMLDKRRYLVGYYPTLKGSFNHQQNTFANKGDLGQLGNPWFPGTSWGLSLNVPIFTGFKRKSWVQQADLRLQQYQLTKEQFEQSYANEVFTARTNYLRAVESYNVQKQNVDLANDIKTIAKIKLQEGLGTSLEYTTAETESATAQGNLIIALYEVMMAEIDYRKAVGNKIVE